MEKIKEHYRVAVVGATGLVGREVLKVLEKKKLPISFLKCIASSQSRGKKILFCGKEIEVEEFSTDSFEGMDIAFFCAGSKNSRIFLPYAQKSKTLVIDSSSAFRMDKEVPLVIPEINQEALKEHKGLIASPNCTATLMLMALFPLHREWKIKRIIAASYQAASGGGAKLIQRLLSETKDFVEGRESPLNSFYPYGFNLYLHDSPLRDNRYSEEEIKMVEESRKILNEPSLLVSATCVRVPILRAHALALNVEFKEKISLEKAYSLLKKTSGVKLVEDFSFNRFPTPKEASEKEEIFCGRLRYDQTQANTLELWVVGDQLLKGAALNAVQIAEQLMRRP